jgi:ribosomal protein L11 methyltransferase
VEVYFGRPPEEDGIRALVAAAAGNDAAEKISFGRVSQRDWVASSLEGLAPVRAGRFLIHGSHGREALRANDIGIEIEAALAFGTGHHGTTRGCLLMLGDIARRRRPRAILDVGTGTGILAIAAARLFRRKVHSGDIDPVSVAAAAANAKLNRAAPFVRPVQSRGAAHPALRRGAPYELVFANILARPLRDLAPSLAKLTAPGGEMVLSGLLGRDVPGVVNAYRIQGMALKRRLDYEGWAVLLMQRGY